MTSSSQSCLRSFCCASPLFNKDETQQKERRQHSSAPGPFVGKGNFVACRSSEILLGVGRRRSSRQKVSVVGVLSSAFVAVRTPTKEGRRKRHFRRRSCVGVPMPKTLQQGAALSLLRLVVDGNNEAQQKERGASWSDRAGNLCVECLLLSSRHSTLLTSLVVTRLVSK
jgi:hypothetical protein